MMGSVIGIFADNGTAWLAADAFCRDEKAVCLPLPAFFTPAQLKWAVQSSGMSVLLTDRPELPLWNALGFSSGGEQAGLSRLLRKGERIDIPAGTAKITFTSGSTGNPKGVCLSRDAMDAVAGSIADIMRAIDLKKHVCALPLAVLLENVAGADAARQAGVEYVCPSLAEIGWSGSSQWDPRAFLRCVQTQAIGSAILLPQMLKSMLPLVKEFDVSSLQMLAVGGARVAPELLLQARKAGLPVYEGYGLSECASVVAFNRFGADKAGTVGKPLPHVQVRVSEVGELEVSGSSFLGYLGELPREASEWLATGDLVKVDNDGFLSITGRRKNLLISSYGRNVSPEWVESELLAQPGILQAAVFGEARPALCAIVFAPQLDAVQVQVAVDAANKSMPDYAQVKHVVRATEPFSASFCPATDSYLATGNGRNKRDAIAAFYAQAINNCYQAEETVNG